MNKSSTNEIKTYFVSKTNRNKNHPLCYYGAIKPPPDAKQTEEKIIPSNKMREFGNNRVCCRFRKNSLVKGEKINK